VAIKINN